MRWPPAFLAVAVLGLARVSYGDEPPAGPWSTEVAVPGDPSATPPAPPRPGRFRLGPLYLSPRFRIGSIGLDSNVLYTPSDRRTDVTAQGGPGLDVVLPLGHATRIVARGDLDYVHFVRTPSLRHLAGGGTLVAMRATPRSELSVSHERLRSYRRPSFEVDERVVEDRVETAAAFRQRLLGRIAIRGGGALGSVDLPPDQQFLGVDLRQSLRDDHWSTRGGVDYTLTVKTRALLEASRASTRFPLAPTRDGTQDEIRGGLETDSTALVSGRLIGGVGWFRPEAGTAEPSRFLIADVDATLHVSPRTHVGVAYGQGLQYSALSRGPSPKLRSRSFRVHAEKELRAQLDLRLSAGITQIRNEGTVALTTPQGVVSGTRQDTAREYSGDLGYRFRSRLRVGLKVAYTDRDSTLQYFGVGGLLVGITMSFTP